MKNLDHLPHRTSRSKQTFRALILYPPPPTRPRGSKGQNSIFSEYGHVAYHIEWNHECSNMVVNILPTDPRPMGWGQKGLNSTFSEHGHVAYRIKWSRECSNIVADSLPTDSPCKSFVGDSKGLT